MNDVTQIFVVLFAFEFKQIFCDYPIHPTFILRRFQADNYSAFIFKALLHAFFTWIICMTLTSAEPVLALGMALLDFFVDFVLTIFRGRSGLISRFRPLDLEEFMAAGKREKIKHRLYWAFFGLDRMSHQLTYFLIVFILCQQGAVWMM